MFMNQKFIKQMRRCRSVDQFLFTSTSHWEYLLWLMRLFHYCFLPLRVGWTLMRKVNANFPSPSAFIFWFHNSSETAYKVNWAFWRYSICRKLREEIILLKLYNHMKPRWSRSEEKIVFIQLSFISLNLTAK